MNLFNPSGDFLAFVCASVNTYDELVFKSPRLIKHFIIVGRH